MDLPILAFDSAQADLETVGGKGRSLVQLTRHGLPVPTGFLIPTVFYRTFIEQNQLQESILKLAKPELVNGTVSFTHAAAKIQEMILAATLADSQRESIATAYTNLAGGISRVAVRSSANAEDLPDLSFAGQQETFLNVSSQAGVLDAVRKCWASLWTAQAMSYRHQNDIEPGSVAMCVVVQVMVDSEVAGILFTANPSTGERDEIVISSSFGLGESVVGGQVTPDTFVINRSTAEITLEAIGEKSLEILPVGQSGTISQEVPNERRTRSSLDPSQVHKLVAHAEQIEAIFDGVPQDIEWAYTGGELHILQARPITNLPVQPIDIEWTVPAPATYVSRRQIVENMPDPICPLFEELYLTEGLESSWKGQNLMVGGGPMFITVNGYAYQRFDFKIVHDQAREKGLLAVAEEEIEAAEFQAEQAAKSGHAEKANKQKATEEVDRMRARQLADIELRDRDLLRFRADLPQTEQAEFDAWCKDQSKHRLGLRVTMPESKNPTYVAFNNSEWNDRQLQEWFDVTRPRLLGVREKWQQVDVSSAPSQTLLDGIREMGIEEGYYWSSNSSHTFGVAKSTDDQLQCFLREALPDHHFISGQFLSGIQSKAMQANADLYEIAKTIQASESLTYLVLTTPTKRLLRTLENEPGPDATQIVRRLRDFLGTYGHQGYSLDFVEPTQMEDPSALLASLKTMVSDPTYDPKDQHVRAQTVRDAKYKEISTLLDGLPYWQFRYRLWLARKYNYIREEVAFLFGYTWSILRPMVTELGTRLVASGYLALPEDVYFLTSAEIQDLINLDAKREPNRSLRQTAAQRREIREARKRHHPPGTLPQEASLIEGISFKETQIKNADDTDQMRGFPVSSGRVTAKASVVTSANEFDKMAPGTILVSPLTTPAWTQLFSHAVGLVTDVGSILAHGSIVAREYGIPAVLGVGNGTKRIQHGQLISIDGDQGIVILHPPAEQQNG